MNKLPADAENRLKEEFLLYLGSIIKLKRRRKNVSQAELGECLGVSESTISRYEAGKQDMAVSTLPLISHYCCFPIREYFAEDSTARLAEIFRELVHISAAEPKHHVKDPDQQIVAQIIMVQGEELRIPVATRLGEERIKVWQRDKFQGQLDTEGVIPFTAEELAEYLASAGNEEKCILLESAGNLLQAARARKALTMEKGVAGFVIEDCLKEKDLEVQKRLVAYYRKLCGEVE